jgi:phenylacetate-CoA ligase
LLFAARQVPFYRDQAWAGRARAGLPIALAEVPITSKQAVKENVTAFHAGNVPPSEGKILEKYTSGSTGVPLHVLKTQRHFRYNLQENQRLSQGWEQGTHRAVLNTYYAGDGHAPGSITEEQGPGGVARWSIYTFASRPIADLLCRVQAPHFNSRPSVVLGVLQEERDFSFLRLISTVSEIVSPELRALIARWPQCRHVDSYGTVETGLLAVACAKCGQYHAATGHAVIEVLRDDGKPAQPGEMGRVVATPLFNLAMPLLRYDLEDYVEVADPKAGCGATRLAFSRIIGRERNLFKLPEGGRITPNIPPEDLLAHGIRRYKLIQTALEAVDFLYVLGDSQAELSAEIGQRLIAAHVSPRLRVRMQRVAEMPVSPGGTFLMHETRI